MLVSKGVSDDAIEAKVKWQQLVSPPEGLSHRAEIELSLAKISIKIDAAYRNYIYSYGSRITLTEDELQSLRKLYDDSLNEAAKLCDQVELRFKA